MKKVIFFTDTSKLHDSISYFNLNNFKDKEVPIKLHMGEMKNKYYSKPDFVRLIVNELKQVGSNPYLYDTTVAYNALRGTKSGYEKLAKIHGFTQTDVGCNVIIDDTGVTVEIYKRKYEVGKHLYDSSHIFALSHVKGHVATGMGGAIKNFGMGGVTRETKSRMHSGSKPIHQKDSCTYCGVCSEVCPFDSIKVKDNSWEYNKRSCFGCGVCVENCTSNALEYMDKNLQYLLACSTKACVQNKNVLYLNDVNRISKSCDCDPYADPIICPDIGYLISDDPVAIDKASLDLINNVKKDVFIKENKVDPIKQINYGEEIGLGSSSYQLIEL